MKKVILLCLVAVLLGCNNKKYAPSQNNQVDSLGLTTDTSSVKDTAQTVNAISKEDYCNSLISPDMGIYNAEITDANILIIAVSPEGNPNFDAFAQSYLDDAISKGVDVNACMVVDVNNSQFQQGAVVGDRIGKAFK
jgi:hypothetical protein